MDSIPDLSLTERKFLQVVVFVAYKLRPIYYWQSLSVWIRIKHHIPFELHKVGILCCFNIVVHYLGPQCVSKAVHVFRQAVPTKNSFYTIDELRRLCTKLCNYTPASHLLPWQIARRIQWYIILRVLNGRIQ